MYDGKFTSSSSNTGNKPRFQIAKALWKWILALIVLVMVISASVYVVPAGNVAVITRFGAISRATPAGIHLKIPFVEQSVNMSVRTQKDQVEATAMSANLQVVTSQIAVNYHLDGNRAMQVFQDVGTNYAEIIVAPAIQNTFKAVTAKFTAEELITKRDEVRLLSELELTKQLESYNIVVENFNIVNFDFSAEYQQAIEAKQVVQQQVETSKQKLAQAQIDAQTVIAQAQGQADAQKALNATGALTPEYLSYLFLTRWNGVLPQVMSGGTNSVIDIGRFLEIPTANPAP